MTFRTDRVPFSLFGSYLSLSALKQGSVPPTDPAALYLRTHRGGGRSVLQLEVMQGTNPVKLEPRAGPNLLRLENEQGFVEVCFSGTNALRLRGRGLGLRFVPLFPTVLYSAAADTFTLNILAVREQYRVAALSGELGARGLYGGGKGDENTAVGSAGDDKNTGDLQRGDAEGKGVETVSGHAVSVTIAGVSVTGEWEVSLQAFGSTPGPEPRQSFESCLEGRRSAFQTWLSGLPAVPERFAEARELAGYVLYSSAVAPSGLFKRPALLMSKNWMDYVWSWDHCFNALALAPGHPGLAWDQLLLMADQQDEHGAYPDAYNSDHAVYNFAKPPVHGWATLELLKRSPAPVPDETLRAVYTSLARWTAWWLDHRVLPGEQLPFYLHGNDSGWDNSTVFDRGVPLMTPDLSAYLVLQLEALGRLARVLNDPAEADWVFRANYLMERLLAELWQEDRFVAKHAGGERVGSQSLLLNMPVVLGRRLPESVRAALKDNIMRFETAHGLATEAPQSDEYRSDGYWRGPMWAPATYLVCKGLEQGGFAEPANRIAEKFCATCAASGFAENFDALSGAGLRDRAYTWTASVFLLLGSGLTD